MATYGYSAGYQGGGPQAVPSGFIEAYSQAGRNIGAGIQQIGSAIGSALQQYGQNKAESEFVQARYEQLKPYIDSVAKTGNVMDERTPESKLIADIGKFSTMSLPQKKAALLNAEFYLDRLDKAKARELQDLQIAQARGQYETTQQLGDLMRYGLTMPTTQTVTEPTTEMLQPVGPVQPAAQPAAAPGAATGPSQAEATAARYFMGRFGQAAEDLRKYGADIGKQAAALNVSPTPQESYPVVFPFPGRPAPQVESPIQAAARVEANRRAQQAMQAQSAAALQQAGIMQKAPPLSTTMAQPAAAAPTGPAKPEFLPPVEVAGETTRTEAVPYEQLRKNIAQYAAQQGMRPEVFAGLDRVLEIAGQRKPTTVEQVGDIGSVVRFGNEERFVPAKEANLENILKVRGLTVNFPEFQGQANTESEAKDFREQYATNLRLREQVADLLELTKLGKAQLQTPENKAKAQGLSRALKATMRKEILGEGVVTQPDQAILDAVIPDPTVLFSWPSANKTALENLVSRANSNLNIKAKSYGLQSISPRTGQTAAAPSGGIIRWNPVTKKLE